MALLESPLCQSYLARLRTWTTLPTSNTSGSWLPARTRGLLQDDLQLGLCHEALAARAAVGVPSGGVQRLEPGPQRCVGQEAAGRAGVRAAPVRCRGGAVRTAGGMRERGCSSEGSWMCNAAAVSRRWMAVRNGRTAWRPVIRRGGNCRRRFAHGVPPLLTLLDGPAVLLENLRHRHHV
jgi:hypothetical protein